MLEKWLTSAGLGHLLSVFETQGIEPGDLAELSEADLRELGLTIGERKRFLRALQTGPAAVATGERRPLTLAFFDLVDSSRLFDELDGEDVAEVLRLYRECAYAALTRFGGEVALLLGDGMLAYFGHPVAHENDSERAVLAALEITAAAPRLLTPAPRPLAVRCGISTGRVVITEIVSGRVIDRRSLTGSTANLAARLQVLAPPDGVVISASTAARVGHLFDLEDTGERVLKGFADPIRVFQVRSRRARPQLPGDLDAAALTAFVGRDEQTAALDRIWAETEAQGGRAALIHGEAGIGKSRLVGAFLRDLAERSEPQIVRLHASALDEHSPLRPFLGHLRERLGISDGASDAEIAEKIRPLLSGASDAEREALAAYLEREAADDATAGGDAARERRALAFDALAGFYTAETQDRPLVLVVEDAHWLDASSRDLVARILAAGRDRPLLLIATSRQSRDVVFPGVEAGLVHEIPLGPLGPEDVLRMVRSSFGDEPVPREVVAGIADRTDGVPLFVEELLRPLLRTRAWSGLTGLAAREGGPSAVPETLQEALTARLDGLGAAKPIVQVAAVIGRSVDAETLARVMHRPEADVATRLDAVCKAGVLRSERTAGRQHYSFQHALLRDTAYDGLLRDQRQVLHARVADAMLALTPDFCAERPDVIARHLTDGGRAAEALPHWLAAGRGAAARSALHEARHALDTGAGIAAGLPQSQDLVDLRLDFAALLGPVLFALCGPGSEESREVYKSAVTLAEAASESGPHFAVLWGWWRLSKDFRVKHERARMLMRLARRRGEAEMLLQAHHCNWASTFHAGEFDLCRDHVEAGLRAYSDPDCVHRPWLFSNHDARVCGLGELAQVMWMQGDLVSARARDAGALDLARQLSHTGTLAHAYDLSLLHRFYRRDADETRRLAETMIELAAEHDLAEHRARGNVFLGWTLAERGDAATGLEVFRQGYRRQREIGTDEDTPVYVCMCAEILNRLGAHDKALHELRAVCGELERLDIRNWLPEVWRMIGETALLNDPGAGDTARDALATALRIATEQNVPMLELRATMSLAATFDEPGAFADLAHIVGAIREPDDCADLTRAEALLRRAGIGIPAEAPR